MKSLVTRLKKSNLLKNTMIYAISDGINKAIPFLILPVIVRFLTTEDYGIITNFMVLVQIITIFAYGAAQGSIPVKFFKLNKADFQGYVASIISICLVVLLFFGLCFFIFGDFLTEWLGFGNKYLYLTLLEVLFGAFTCINMLLWRCEEKPIKFGITPFFNKRFGRSGKNSYLCTTRTRQASSQCLNRRVVFLYYGKVFKNIFITSSTGKAVAISRTVHWEYGTNGELSSSHRLLQI